LAAAPVGELVDRVVVDPLAAIGPAVGRAAADDEAVEPDATDDERPATTVEPLPGVDVSELSAAVGVGAAAEDERAD
jgi:hypothetical protein